VMAQEGLPVQMATRVLGVSESGYYAFRQGVPSARAVRHAMLTDLIREVHVDSRGTYGARRVRAELVLGRGLVVSHVHCRAADEPGVHRTPCDSEHRYEWKPRSGHSASTPSPADS
jgi:hypothetical protein